MKMKKLKKILLVDDDHNLIDLLSYYLSAEGFFVDSAYTIRNALAFIDYDCPDLIISDIMIKDLSGYDFIKLLRLDDSLVDLPFIFLTAKGMTSDRIKGYNLGCFAYLTKPFNPKELLAIINNIFTNINLIKSRNKFNFNMSKKFRNSKFLQSFTTREKHVLKLLLMGYMNKEIAVKLDTSLRNVERYVSRLLYKTNTRNRVELIRTVIYLV
uniref:putative transcriptional regulator Ycf29 n=1 Tax=Laurencia catarinensis TaxID=197326 RepID=UPI0028D0F590|nr:putative transcriptional regulator Ycf29 [Laurencia catarinensis]WMP12565.1 putative transcriptional regulator Ycf29 [Laurencia catarinensis]